MKRISGGVCAAKGFKAGGIHCGIRHSRTKRDLALIVSSVRAAGAGIYTRNLVKGAPILVTKQHLEDGHAQAIIVNSGNANTCNANGVEIAEGMCELTEQYTGIPANDVLVASTGVIGQEMTLVPIEAGMASLTEDLSVENNTHAVEAIMTTDTRPKECAVEFELGGVICHLGSIAKGSGMIHPNMATMLVFVTTDAAISPEMLKKALVRDADATFHMISVDGDTSTNDTEVVLANGLAGNALVDSEGADFETFCAALNFVTTTLCRAMAKDGEGATRLLECAVEGACTLADARIAAKAVICSPLTKSAMFGADANWGRVLCALGYSGATLDPQKVDVSFVSRAGRVDVCKGGFGLPFSEGKAKKVLSEDEITIEVALHDGEFSAKAWGCDLTYDYVKINGDYRT